MTPSEVGAKPNDSLLPLEPSGHLDCIILSAGGGIGFLGKVYVETLGGFSVEAIKAA